MPRMKMTEQAILDAAAEEFADKGFNGARVDSIAKRAGINKAMLYYRIGDKKELYRRVILRGQASIRSAIMNAISSSTTAADTIGAMLKAISDNATENRLTPSIILRELAGNAQTLPETARENIDKFMNTFRSMVTLGVDEGSFRNIDPTALQFIVTGAVFTLSLTADLRRSIDPMNPGPLTSEQIAESIMDILMHGILKEGTG